MTIYDLHSHSIASDGTLTPTELVAFAKACGTDVLALTDHDITDGISEACAVAFEYDICLVAGIELSVSWGQRTIHIVGLQIDPNNHLLQEGIRQLQHFRTVRAQRIAAGLELAGIPGAMAGAERLAQGRIISRTHFARFLVEGGYAKDVKQVFKKYLVRNKPGHVAGEWAPLEDAVNWIRASGGLAVIAHPARYEFSMTKMRQLLAEFRDAGGSGIEVVSSSHTVADVQRYTRLAQEFGLYASRGSDYHGQHTPYADPRRLGPLPENCRPIWSHSDWMGVE